MFPSGYSESVLELKPAALIYDYAIEGSVQSVLYGFNKEWPCYIALNTTDTQDLNINHRYHASKDYEKCKFAERMKLAKVDVKLYAQVLKQAHVVFAIEFAHTNATDGSWK